MLKTIIGKLERKKNNDIGVDVAQLEQSNNKCYASIFRYIYIYIDFYMLCLIFYNAIG